MIFISYSRATDADFALRLALYLKERGASIWMDRLDIPAGSHWDVAIENALRAATLVLVVLTAESVASHNVMDEVTFALDERKVIIPILLRPCQVPFRLRRLQYVDFSAAYERGLEELLRFLPITPPPQTPVRLASQPPDLRQESDTAVLSLFVHADHLDSFRVATQLSWSEEAARRVLEALCKEGYLYGMRRWAKNGLFRTEYRLSDKGRKRAVEAPGQQLLGP
jgi:uncharacterized protein YbdZ (MbtH family)